MPNYLQSQKIPSLSNLALKIITSEKGQEIYLQKVQKEIIKINENKNLFKINNLTIMLLGKSGVGKSTLINSFLKLEGNQLEQKARNINLYQSLKIQFCNSSEFNIISFILNIFSKDIVRFFPLIIESKSFSKLLLINFWLIIS